MPLFWEEDLHDLVFKLRADEGMAGRRILGSIDVLVDGAVIGDLPVSLRVADGTLPTMSEDREVTKGRLYRRIFASYSQRDEAIVRASVSTYEALGIYVYLDKDELRNRSGEAWKEALRRFIASSDAFQLYWSERARDSKWVEMEWRHALTCTGSKGQRFVRPIVWEDDFPALPRPLAELQVGLLRLDLWRLGLADEPPAPGTITGGAEPEVVVLPCRPGIDPATLRVARADAAFAVRFIEETTGLRYYPVATLLVDDFVVRSVRRESTTDELPERDKAGEARALAALLQAIALEFHVQFRSSLSREGDLAAKFGKGSLVEPCVYDRVREYCEWVIGTLVRQWPGVAADALRASLAEEGGADAPLSVVVRGLVERLAAEVEAGRGRSLGVPLHTLTAAEYALLRGDLSQVGVRADERDDGSVWLEVDSIEPYGRLARRVVDEVEEAIRRFDASLDAGQGPPPRTRLLSRFVSSGVSGAPSSVGESLSAVVEGAMNPLWRRVAAKLAESGVEELATEATAAQVIAWLLETVSGLLVEGAKRLGEPTVEVGYAVPAEAWVRCREILGDRADVVDAATEELPPWSGGEPGVLLTGSLGRIQELLVDAARRLTDLLPSLRSADEALGLAVVASTFGIFTPPGSPSVDDSLRRWAREVGTPPALTLSGSARVLLSLSALDRFRALLAKSGQSPSQARLHQRSVLVHEHFHAAVASGLDTDGRLPQGPRHPNAWAEATPVNEALAAWMELHLSRDLPEARALVENYQARGRYPQWPYAGAGALEAAYGAGGLNAIREWVRRLRDDPAACRAAFDAFVGERSA